MTNLNRWPSWRQGIAVIVLLVGGVVALASPASSHVREAPHRWSFSPQTQNQGDHKVKQDPVNILFFKYGTASLNSVKDHMYADWGGRYVNGQNGPYTVRLYDTKMMDHGCWMSDQSLAFWAWDDKRYYGSVWDNNQDASTQNQSRCRRPKYHLRLWDDVEHKDMTFSHGDLNQWVVGGVHHEHWVWRYPLKDSNDEIDREWDLVEKQFRTRMGEHCGKYKWRYLPGSGISYHRYPSDGYITLITMAHRTAEGRCPPLP